MHFYHRIDFFDYFILKTTNKFFEKRKRLEKKVKFPFVFFCYFNNVVRTFISYMYYKLS